MLADAHALVRAGLRLLIETKLGMTVVGEAGNLAQALDVATRMQPDVILLELNLGDTNFKVIPQLLTVAKHARLLLVTGIHDINIHSEAVEMGAVGVVSKEESAEMLGKAIAKVHAGQIWLNRSTTANVLARMTRNQSPGRNDNGDNAKIATLSPRERQVISLIGQGLKNKEIASKLSLSETTVRHHLTSIFSKLGVSDRLELIVFAYRHQLAKLPL